MQPHIDPTIEPIWFQPRLFELEEYTQPGYLYAGVRHGWIKIGFSLNPRCREQRLKMQLLGIWPNKTKDDEQRVHRALRSDLMAHEWYRPGPRVVSFVEQLPIRFPRTGAWPPRPSRPALRWAA